MLFWSQCNFVFEVVVSNAEFFTERDGKPFLPGVPVKGAAESLGVVPGAAGLSVTLLPDFCQNKKNVGFRYGGIWSLEFKTIRTRFNKKINLNKKRTLGESSTQMKPNTLKSNFYLLKRRT